MKTTMSGVLWGEAHINGITNAALHAERERRAQSLVERVMRETTEADADKQRAMDLLDRARIRSARSRHNSEGFGE